MTKYEQTAAAANKLLQPDGSITLLDGTPVDESTAVDEYKNQSPQANKFLNPDGSIVTSPWGSGGGVGAIVETVADLDNVPSPYDGLTIAVVETGTFWTYNETLMAWENTGTEAPLERITYLGGDYSDLKQSLTINDTKTDSQLIELFGIKSAFPITVDQSGVDYTQDGDYPVVFSFGKGLSFTTTLNIRPIISFDDLVLEKNTTSQDGLQLVQNADLTNLEVVLNGAPAPTITNSGKKYMWYNQNLEALTNMEIYFRDAFANYGETIDIKATIEESVVYSNNPLFQKIGFEIVTVAGEPLDILEVIQAGVTGFNFKLEFFDASGKGIDVDDIKLRIGKLNFDKYSGVPFNLESKELFVENATKLKGGYGEFNNDKYVLCGSDSTDTFDDVDDIALGIQKRNAGNISISVGKVFTGNRNSFDYGALGVSEERYSLRLNVAKAESSNRQDFLVKATGIGEVTETFTEFASIPSSFIKAGEIYEFKLRLNATRDLGSNNVGELDLRVLEGATQKGQIKRVFINKDFTDENFVFVSGNVFELSGLGNISLEMRYIPASIDTLDVINGLFIVEQRNITVINTV